MTRILHPCPFGTEKNRVLFWRGRSSPQSRVAFIVRTGSWEECKRNNFYVTTSLEVAATLTGMLKTAQEG